MTEKSRKFKILALFILGFYSILTIRPDTMNLVLCCQSDGCTQLEMASLDFSCICSHTHDTEHHDNHGQSDQNDKSRFTGMEIFCKDIPITANGFVTNIPSPLKKINSFNKSSLFIIHEVFSTCRFFTTRGTEKLPQLSLYKTLFTILC